MIRFLSLLCFLVVPSSFSQSTSNSQPWSKPSLDLVFYKSNPNLSFTYPVMRALNPRFSIYKDSRLHFGAENLFTILRGNELAIFFSIGAYGEVQNNDIGPILGIGGIYYLSNRIHLDIEAIVSPSEDVIDFTGYPILPRLGLGYSF